MSASEPQPGAVVLITNDSHDRFLMQVKDDCHPLASLRGCLSFFGGSLEEGETPPQGLDRELREEILDEHAVAELASGLAYWKSFDLDGNQFKVEYKLYAFVRVLSNEAFERVCAGVTAEGVVTEGSPRVYDRETLVEMLPDTNRFVASLDVVLAEFLDGSVRWTQER